MHAETKQPHHGTGHNVIGYKSGFEPIYLGGPTESIHLTNRIPNFPASVFELTSDSETDREA